MIGNKTTRIRSWLVLTIGLLMVVALIAMTFPAPAQAIVCKARHSVKSTDTLAKIASQYRVSVQDIVAVNNLVPPHTIYVYQTLCIPGVSQFGGKVPKNANALAANFFAYVRNDKLNIILYNFPHNSSYYVKIRGNRLGNYEIKLALLKVAGSGNKEVSYSLPKPYLVSTQYQVCLKNVYTSSQVCRTALK